MDERHVEFGNSDIGKFKLVHLTLHSLQGTIDPLMQQPTQQQHRARWLKLVQYDNFGLPNQNSHLLLGGLHCLQDMHCTQEVPLILFCMYIHAYYIAL